MEFSVSTNFCFCSLLVQGFFFQVKPSARIAFFFSEILIHYIFIAELLRVEGAQVEPHSLENLVTHQPEKIWL